MPQRLLLDKVHYTMLHMVTSCESLEHVYCSTLMTLELCPVFIGLTLTVSCMSVALLLVPFGVHSVFRTANTDTIYLDKLTTMYTYTTIRILFETIEIDLSLANCTPTILYE